MTRWNRIKEQLIRIRTERRICRPRTSGRGVTVTFTKPKKKLQKIMKHFNFKNNDQKD